MMTFVIERNFSFMRSHLVIVDLSAYVNSIPFSKSFLMPKSSRLFSTFSSIRFATFGFMLRSLIYLELSLLQGDDCGSI